jgi:biopolymer transport protein ExbB/TolQ
MHGLVFFGANFLDSIALFFEQGGPFMYVNVFVAATALAMILERSISLLFRYSINGGPFMDQVSRLVLAGNVDRAIKLCAAAPNASLARVVRAGLSRANQGEVEIAKAIEEALLEETPKIQKRVQSLFSIANIATLLGLIGTIFGLIAAFKSLQFAAPEQKQALLARGISEAMNNTAFGLSIAVSCIVGHMLLTNRAKGMVEELETASVKVENLLGQRKQEAASRASSGIAA